MPASEILVVEDEAIVAAAIKNELEDFGYTVRDIAVSASEAVEIAVRHRPDLILMDIHLRGKDDGIEAAREIRKRCRIPVVFLSAFADADTLARAEATEAFGYLLKPYEERELHTTIEMALGKHRAEERLEEAERVLVAILDGIGDAVIATTPDKQIRFMNLAGEALTGCRKQDVVGAPVSAVCNLVDGGKRLRLEELADRAVCDSRRVALPPTARLLTRDGRETPVEGSLTPIHDRHGELLGEVLTLRKMAARPELERGRRRAPEQMRQARKVEAVRRRAEDAPAQVPALPQSRPRGSKPMILLAEADARVRDFARRILEEEGYQVLVAEDGLEAVDIFRQAKEQIDLAIVDCTMPRLMGDAILEALLDIDPNVEVLFSSSYFAEDRTDADSRLLGVLSKPYSRHELLRMVKQALARRSLMN
jgi:PAS domain S-box-containing protein